MNKLVLIWFVVSLIVSGSIVVFADQGFGDKEVFYRPLGDINNDGQKEIAQETTSWGASSCGIFVKILSGKKTIFQLPGLSGDTADGYKVIGNKIVIWQGKWQSTQTKWDPHYYKLIWYEWNSAKKKYLFLQESTTNKAYSYKDAEKTLPLLVQKPIKPNLSQTITDAVKFYCLNNRSPGWPRPPLQVRYQFKQTKGDWASIATKIVDKKEQTMGEYCFFLLHRSKNRWTVVWFSDEKNIRPSKIEQLNVDRKIIADLGWSSYSDG